MHKRTDRHNFGLSDINKTYVNCFYKKKCIDTARLEFYYMYRSDGFIDNLAKSIQSSQGRLEFYDCNVEHVYSNKYNRLLLYCCNLIYYYL